MDGKQITVKEALEEAVQILNNIKIPVGFTEEIAIPIRNALLYLTASKDAIGTEEKHEEINPE